MVAVSVAGLIPAALAVSGEFSDTEWTSEAVLAAGGFDVGVEGAAGANVWVTVIGWGGGRGWGGLRGRGLAGLEVREGGAWFEGKGACWFEGEGAWFEGEAAWFDGEGA